MHDLTLISKLSALPAHLHTQAADYIDYLWQKATRATGGPAGTLPNGSETGAPHTGHQILEDDIEVLSPFLSDGSPRLSLTRGAGKHFIAYIADDFDAPLEDFKDYM